MSGSVGSRRLGGALCALGLGLVPWTASLAARGEWGWATLDVAEAAGLITTGMLVRRGRSVRVLATTTAALLLADAGVEIVLAHRGELTLAFPLARAVFAEIPTAAMCLRAAGWSVRVRQEKVSRRGWRDG